MLQERRTTGQRDRQAGPIRIRGCGIGAGKERTGQRGTVTTPTERIWGAWLESPVHETGVPALDIGQSPPLTYCI